MNPLDLHLKQKILIPLSLVLILVMIISSFFFYNHQVKVWENNQISLNYKLNEHFEDTIKQNVSMMQVAIESLEHDPEIINNYKEQNRDRLYQKIAPIYAELNQNHQITHFYFTNTNQTNFLRVHQPARFGDSINRQTMLQAVKTGKPAWGLEIGPLGTYTLRLVSPLHQQGHRGGELIGYMELGMEIEHALNNLANELKVELVVLMSKHAIKKELWQQGMKRLQRNGDWSQFSSEVMLYSSQPALPAPLVQHIEQRHQHTPSDSEYTILKTDGSVYNIGFVPLQTLNQEENGTVMILSDITHLAQQLTQQIEYIILVTLFISLLYIITLYSYLSRIERSIFKSHQDAEAELLQSETRLKEAQRLGQIGNWVLDLKKHKLDWSKEIYELFQFDPKTTPPSYEKFLSIIHPEDLEQVNHTYTEEVKLQANCQTQHRLLLESGEIKWSEDRIETLYDREGKPALLRGTVQDITRHKEAEEKIEQASRAKDEFLASMSHELRTPLTNIIGNCEFLGEQESDSEKQKMIQSIEISGRSQLALVNDILDISKIESGKFTIDENPYNLNTLIDNIQHIFSMRMQDAGLTFKLEQQETFPNMVLGDAQRIGQILINLIGNAVKFTEAGGTVTLRLWSASEQLHFSVEDTGIGMTSEVQQRLFQRFEQADNSISRRFGGSGLGLYVSGNLAQLMGGSIEVESSKGKGSRFQLNLPYHPTNSAAPSQAQELKNSQVNQEELLGTNLNAAVLIAEDTPELQLLERRILESMGATVTTADNGKIAIELATAHHFDLILMDMQMPETNGIEATKILRAAGNNVPIVALTANVMQKHRDAFNEAGCNGFLEKPINKQELSHLIQQILQQHPASNRDA